MSARVHYTTRIPGIIRDAEDKADRIIRKGAFDILAASQQVVPVAKENGGNLKTSGHVETGHLSATIGYSAEYAIYVHEGTYKMAARPFLREPFDRIAPKILRALDAVVKP
jgi:HK97 gp10 family phage protein